MVLKVGGEALGKGSEAMGKFRRVRILIGRGRVHKGAFKNSGFKVPSFVADNGYWWQRYV
jgi:hypothetical protein